MEDTTAGIETWGKGARRVRGKASKQDLIKEISNLTGTKVLDIYALNLKDLKDVLKVVESGKVISVEVLPEGRFKSPYLEVLESVLPNTPNLQKLPVSSLGCLVEALSGR